MNNHKSSETRKLAIEYYLKNKVSQSEVSKIFQVSEKTFKRWLKQYRDNNSLERKSRLAVAYKVRESHVKYILKLVKKNPTWSIQMYMSNIKEKYSDFEISNSQLSQVIRDNNLTRKRTRTTSSKSSSTTPNKVPSCFVPLYKFGKCIKYIFGIILPLLGGHSLSGDINLISPIIPNASTSLDSDHDDPVLLTLSFTLNMNI